MVDGSRSAVSEVAELAIPVGGRVLLFGSAHLSVPATASSEQAAAEVARAIVAASGPGAVVVTGDLFELAAQPAADVDTILRAHPRLRDALASYAAEADHQLVVLAGSHDAALAGDDKARRTVESQLGARVALGADLVVHTGSGVERVRVEPGHDLGATGAPADPRSGGESPPVGAPRPDLDSDRRTDRSAGLDRNDHARRRAVRLLADGYCGYVSGHTQEPELADLGGGFYVNVGGVGEVLERRRGRLGLPDAFAVGRRLSWVELAAGPGLSAQLRWGRQALPTTTVLQRLTTRPVTGGEPRPTVVAEWPDGSAWPVRSGEARARRVRVRRQAAAVLAVVGLVDLVSAITPPLATNLRVLTDILPIEVPQTAAVLVVLAGIALLTLSRGVRRGQRHAWGLAVALLGVTGALHLVKGLDVSEAVISLGVAAYLGANRSHFRARVDESSARRSLVTLALGAVFGHRQPGWWRCWPLGGRRTGRPRVDAFRGRRRTTHRPHHRRPAPPGGSVPGNRRCWPPPSVFGLAQPAGCCSGRCWPRPSMPDPPSRSPPPAASSPHTKGDTLAYFALRDDKRFWFFGRVGGGLRRGHRWRGPGVAGPTRAARQSATTCGPGSWPTPMTTAGPSR